MPMPPYPIRCYASDCTAEARYKVAARWSDGITAELKTYFLSCAACLPKLFHEACRKRNACRIAPNETLDVPGIYELVRDARDRALQRRADLEEAMQTSAVNSPSAS